MKMTHGERYTGKQESPLSGNSSHHNQFCRREGGYQVMAVRVPQSWLGVPLVWGYHLEGTWDQSVWYAPLKGHLTSGWKYCGMEMGYPPSPGVVNRQTESITSRRICRNKSKQEKSSLSPRPKRNQLLIKIRFFCPSRASLPLFLRE